MKWRFNIAVFIIIVFIFFNDVGLPYGLQYTALLAPLFFLKYSLKYWKVFAGFIAVSGVYLLIHVFNEELTWFYYGRSWLLHFLVFIQVVAFYHIVKYKGDYVKKAFDQSVYINFILLLLGVGLLIVGLPDFMFEVSKVSESLGVMPRFRIFTQEPSYYSMLFVLLLFFYLSQSLDAHKSVDFEKITIIIISLLISFSFGVLSVVLMAAFMVYFLRIKNLMEWKRLKVMLSLTIIVLGILGALYLFSPDNPIFTRFRDIISGNDGSGNGRIVEPWILCFKMLGKHQDFLFGIGWGQIRTIGHDIIKSFYEYTNTPQNKFGLPNILTEITTMFGFVGLAIVLLLELVLFWTTKVKNSYFRSLVFWFIFIYQFTGSYSSSVLFYCFWVLAFCPAFDEQLRKRMKSQKTIKKTIEE